MPLGRGFVKIDRRGECRDGVGVMWVVGGVGHAFSGMGVWVLFNALLISNSDFWLPLLFDGGGYT